MLEKVDQHNESAEWRAFAKRDFVDCYAMAWACASVPTWRSASIKAGSIDRTVVSLNRPARSPSTATRRLTNRLRRHAEYLFTFLDCPEVPFEDNFFVERQIRPAVILRKNSESNRSDHDAATQAILMSVDRILRLRGLDPIKTIANALRTCLTTGQLPPLPG